MKESYGISFSTVCNDGKVDVGLKYEDSTGFKYDKNFKDVDEDKAYSVVSKDLVAAYAAHAKKLKEDETKKTRTVTTSTPVDVNDRIAALEESNRKLAEQNKRLQEAIDAANKARETPKPKYAAKTVPAPKPKTRPKAPEKRDEASDAYDRTLKLLNDLLDDFGVRKGLRNPFIW